MCMIVDADKQMRADAGPKQNASRSRPLGKRPHRARRSDPKADIRGGFSAPPNSPFIQIAFGAGGLARGQAWELAGNAGAKQAGGVFIANLLDVLIGAAISFQDGGSGRKGAIKGTVAESAIKAIAPLTALTHSAGPCGMG